MSHFTEQKYKCSNSRIKTVNAVCFVVRACVTENTYQFVLALSTNAILALCFYKQNILLLLLRIWNFMNIWCILHKLLRFYKRILDEIVFRFLLYEFYTKSLYIDHKFNVWRDFMFRLHFMINMLCFWRHKLQELCISFLW